MILVPLLALIFCVLGFCDIADVGLSLGAGLSAKNILVYMGGGLLFLQSRLGKQYQYQLRELHSCFAILILYSAISMFIVSGLVQYPGYKVTVSAIQLKAGLVDWFVFFAVFFYGTNTPAEARGLIKVLLLVVACSSTFTVIKVAGLTDFGATVVGGSEDAVGRVQGVWGDANESGTILACLLPIYIAAAMEGKRLLKLFWIAASLPSLVVIFMTASRGALIALLLGGAWAAWACRRHVSYARAIRVGGIVTVVLLTLAVAFGHDYLNAFIHRFTNVNTASAASLTSGRSEVWGRAVGHMIDNPITLITGFGWNAWSVMGYFFVAHNHYLWLWFELGLVGVVCFVLLYRQIVMTVLAKIGVADKTDRHYMVSFVFCFLILAVGIFFVLITKGWFYMWPLIGLAMRYALSIGVPSQSEAVARQPAARKLSRRMGAVKLSPRSARVR